MQFPESNPSNKTPPTRTKNNRSFPQALTYSASRTSKQIAHLNSIFVSTHAVLFLGTPHHGSDIAKLARTAQRMLSAVAPKKAIDTDSQLLDALQTGSETLQNITDQFAPLMKNFHIYFFWEQEKTNLGYTRDYVSQLLLAFQSLPHHSTNLSFPMSKVVPESSAAPILDDTERSGIPAPHALMCKFDSSASPGYRPVAAALLRYSRDAPDVIALRWGQARERLRALRLNEAGELMR